MNGTRFNVLAMETEVEPTLELGKNVDQGEKGLSKTYIYQLAQKGKKNQNVKPNALGQKQQMNLRALDKTGNSRMSYSNKGVFSDILAAPLNRSETPRTSQPAK